MSKFKTFAICCALLLTAPLSLTAGEHIYCKSPDGKFALRETFTELNPIHGDTAIIETGTRKVAVQLHGDEPAGSEKLVWSRDSRRVASFRCNWQSGATRIFFRNGSIFDEIKMPELPSTQLPDLPKPDASNSETMRRVEPSRWLESGDLLLESELQNKADARAALQITMGFDPGNQPMIRKSEKEKMSVLDYFLLLPPDTFEGPAYTWLNVMRANGELIDKENGYMSCPGDGAQPEFEIALFRYHDGRPLLALCAGELEGADSTQLQFFELGAAGKMHQISRPILPGTHIKSDPGMGYVKKGWQFECREKAAQSSCDQKRLRRSYTSSPGTEKNFRRKNRRSLLRVTVQPPTSGKEQSATNLVGLRRGRLGCSGRMLFFVARANSCRALRERFRF
ncbi:MAG: hypothetical protein DMF37_02425 [Verrucomicrobia bacterium]|nr:MAG: hypothetical protein DMF37_02425 [Verrucomicrobiota bacterium]